MLLTKKTMLPKHFRAIPAILYEPPTGYNKLAERQKKGATQMRCSLREFNQPIVSSEDRDQSSA